MHGTATDCSFTVSSEICSFYQPICRHFLENTILWCPIRSTDRLCLGTKGYRHWSVTKPADSSHSITSYNRIVQSIIAYICLITVKFVNIVMAHWVIIIIRACLINIPIPNGAKFTINESPSILQLNFEATSVVNSLNSNQLYNSSSSVTATHS